MSRICMWPPATSLAFSLSKVPSALNFSFRNNIDLILSVCSFRVMLSHLVGVKTSLSSICCSSAIMTVFALSPYSCKDLLADMLKQNSDCCPSISLARYALPLAGPSAWLCSCAFLGILKVRCVGTSCCVSYVSGGGSPSSGCWIMSASG